jgi:hypothetical protein
MTVGPIREWPGALTPASQRKLTPFKTNDRDFRRRPVPLSQTLELLDRELRMLDAKDAEMLVAIAPQDFRRDGRPRAGAKAEHPGVILSFTTKIGKLSYPCDTFTTWPDNLRAIALALEALRKVDRYGVTSHGEQYRGFLAIEAGTAMPAGFGSRDEVIDFLAKLVGWERPFDADAALRFAKRKTHPDLGGDAVSFQRVTLAETYLKKNGAN